jgi:hypothetical protein
VSHATQVRRFYDEIWNVPGLAVIPAVLCAAIPSTSMMALPSTRGLTMGRDTE